MADFKLLANISNNTFRFIISGSMKLCGKAPESDLEVNTKRVALILLTTFGFLGNIFIIVLAMKYTVRKNLHHLIINMAVSDNLFIIMCLLDIIQWQMSSNKLLSHYPDGILGDFLCKARGILYEVSYKVSLVTLLTFSIERFRATRQTLQRARPYTLKKRLAVVLVCWAAPLVIEVYRLHYQKNAENGRCLIYADNFSKYYLFLIACAIVAVMITIFTLSIWTIRRLSRLQNIHAHLNQEQQNMRTRRTKAAVLMVLASALLSACCWLPTLIFSSISKSILATSTIITVTCTLDWKSFTFMTAYFLPLFNSCFSPCIYIIFLPDFREAVKKILSRRVQPIRRPSIELQSIRATSSLGPNRKD